MHTQVDSRQQNLQHLLALLRNEFVARAARAPDRCEAVLGSWKADRDRDRPRRVYLRSRDMLALEREAEARSTSPTRVLCDEWPTARWRAWMRLPESFRSRTRRYGAYLNPGRWLAFLLSSDAEHRAGLDKVVDERTHDELRVTLEVDRGRGRTSANPTNVRRGRREVSLEALPDSTLPDDVQLDELVALRLDLAAELERVNGVATETQRQQLEAVHAKLRDHPELTWPEAWAAAGFTQNQRKNLVKRLRRRLA